MEEVKDHVVIHSTDGIDVIAFGPMTETEAIRLTNAQPYYRREVRLIKPAVSDWMHK